MVATGMSEREEGMARDGMRFGKQKKQAATHAYAHARTHILSSKHYHQPNTGKASETGKASVNRDEAQDRTSEGGKRKENWKEG